MLLNVTSVFSLQPLPVMRCQLKKKKKALILRTQKHKQALRLTERKKKSFKALSQFEK